MAAVVMGTVSMLFVPAILKGPCEAYQGTASHLISQLDQAVESYRIDFGAYPPGDGSGSRSLVEHFRRMGPRGRSYFEFPQDLLTKSGDVINPVRYEREVIRYRCPGVHRPGKFDLWAADCAGNPTGINNW